MLSTCLEGHPFDWEQQLKKVCMAYNTSVQSSTGFTPFYLMFGRQARLPVDIIYETGAPEGESTDVGTYVTSLKRRMSEAFEIVWRNVSKHHQHQKILYDKKVHGKTIQAWRLGLASLTSNSLRKLSQATSPLEKTMYNCKKDIRFYIQGAASTETEGQTSCPF